MYAIKERLIYAYSDGRRKRFGDPLAIEDLYNEGLAEADQFGSLEELLKSPDRRIRFDASDRLLPVIHAAFGVKPWNPETGEGVSAGQANQLLRNLWAWKAKIRRKYRRLAEHVAIYGHDPGRPLDYEAFVGLTFNTERVAAIQAVQTARGIISALAAKTHDSLYDAMATTESRIGWVKMQVEQERAEDEALARVGGKLDN